MRGWFSMMLLFGVTLVCLVAGSSADGTASGVAACQTTPRSPHAAPGLSTLSGTWWYRNYIWMGIAGAFHGEGFVADPRGQKIGWYRQRRGVLHVYARRLDGPAASFVADLSPYYGTIGFEPSGLTFGTPGCWAITAVVGRQASRFVVTVAPFNP